MTLTTTSLEAEINLYVVHCNCCATDSSIYRCKCNSVYLCKWAACYSSVLVSLIVCLNVCFSVIYSVFDDILQLTEQFTL